MSDPRPTEVHLDRHHHRRTIEPDGGQSLDHDHHQHVPYDQHPDDGPGRTVVDQRDRRRRTPAGQGDLADPAG